MKALVVLGFAALGLSLWLDSVFIVLTWVFVYLGVGAAKQCKAETGSYRAFVQGATNTLAWGCLVGLLLFLIVCALRWLP